MRFLKFFLCFLILLHFTNNAAWAERPNNKFGIHLGVVTDIELRNASALVNSSGGEWGYVTFVINEKEMDKHRWQQVFEQMRELHLIPIVRLATSFANGSWRRPDPQEAEKWANFLNSLNWVVKNRYIVLFNEPNHGDEWGGQTSPENYGEVAYNFARTLKEKNPDFFVMPAGFDSASPHKPPNFEDEEIFLRQMFSYLVKENKPIFNYLDGWASHSYPNHGFIGSPWDEGRNSVKNYLWEETFLNRLGIDKKLPIFITETGWPHAEGKNYQRGLYTQDAVALNFRTYFNRMTSDSRVMAVTPFILNYQDVPFDHFSWQRLGNQSGFYPQYEAVSQLPKTKGDPIQEQRFKFIRNLPLKLTANSTYQIPLAIRNEGQAIWSLKDNYQLRLVDGSTDFNNYFFSDFSNLKPFDEETLWFYLKTGDKLGKFDLNFAVFKNGKPVSNLQPWVLTIIPAIDIDFTINLFPKRKTSGDDFKLLIYNSKEEVIFEKEGIKVENSLGKITEVHNLTVGEKYRLVFLKPNYLPRQGFLIVKEGKNEINFRDMLPFDFDQDGKFSLKDILVLFEKPNLFQIFWPN